jgi:HAE1 family hydrophobic/amphiphilic exporter-1
MLFGIVKKNGILQVDYTNTLLATGMAREEAVFKANMVRLRPILMTTVTLIAGMTPIALGQGPGASSRASMAKVIIGGQALSLVITLLIVPVAYILFDDATAFLRDRLPEGLKARATWARLMAGGAAAIGTWALLFVIGLMGGLPVWLTRAAGLLALAGLVAFGVGCQAFRTAARTQEEPAS